MRFTDSHVVGTIGSVIRPPTTGPQHKKAGGGYEVNGPQWYVGLKDDNGCNNGKVKIAKAGYTAGKKKVPMLRVPVFSEDDEKDWDDRLVYPKVWNNPYIDG